MMLRSLVRARRGSAITEFALSSTILIFVLMMTMEFGVEIFIRQQTERAVGAAAAAYATSRSPSQAQDAALATMSPAFRECLQPLDVVLHNNISSLKNGSGRAAQGNSSDDGAHIARIALTCRWDRITPAIRLMLGDTLVHEAISFVRIR